MKKGLLIVSLFTAIMLMQSVALAQEALTPVLEAQIGEPVKEVTKEVKVDKKSWVRVIGSKTFAPGQKKANSLAATAKALAPGQVKKTMGAVSARGFVRGPAEISARKKQMFQDISMKQKPQKPLKGQKTTFRGTPYKPTKL